MLSIITMFLNSAPRLATVQRSQTDSLVTSLVSEFPGTTACAIRVAVLQAEHDLWPKKDAYILLDHARDLLQCGSI